jgi:tetratricopeptide (TPR) repeat protein
MDVNIEVRYTVQGAPGLYGMSNNLEYTYMLVSGKAWKDTIGSAEIILTAPYSLTDKTLLGYQPQGAVVNGSEIRWRFENFEPDANITAGLMDPGHWALINNQVKAVTDNPQDGEAWARLARAYRDAVISKPVGFHGGLGGFEYYGQSLTAFAKAVGLRPADADLRIDYAELLIHNAFTPFAGDSAAVYDSLVLAVEQLQRAIKIQPNHPRAYLLMKDLESWPNAPRKLVDLSGAQPNFLILTPGGPTTTPVPSLTRTPFPASLTPTATWTRNPTRTPTRTATATVTAPARTFTPLVIAEVQQAATEAPAQPGPRSSPLCGAALLPVLSLLAWAALRK